MVSYSSLIKYQLLCGSNFLSIKLDWIEWWSGSLVPGVHYVPLSDKCWEDIGIVWNETRANPIKSETISKTGRDLATTSLDPDDVYCYWECIITLVGSHLPVLAPEDPLPPNSIPLEDLIFYPMKKTINA